MVASFPFVIFLVTLNAVWFFNFYFFYGSRQHIFRNDKSTKNLRWISIDSLASIFIWQRHNAEKKSFNFVSGCGRQCWSCDYCTKCRLNFRSIDIVTAWCSHFFCLLQSEKNSLDAFVSFFHQMRKKNEISLSIEIDFVKVNKKRANEWRQRRRGKRAKRVSEQKRKSQNRIECLLWRQKLTLNGVCVRSIRIRLCVCAVSFTISTNRKSYFV